MESNGLFANTYEPVPDAYTQAEDTLANYTCEGQLAPNSPTSYSWMSCLRAYCTSTVCIYVFCVLFDFLAYSYKVVILYWSALFLCVLASISCCRCSSLALVLQIVYGVGLYMYVWNFAGFWNRPHYRPSNTWPWTPHVWGFGESRIPTSGGFRCT